MRWLADQKNVRRNDVGRLSQLTAGLRCRAVAGGRTRAGVMAVAPTWGWCRAPPPGTFPDEGGVLADDGREDQEGQECRRRDVG